MKTKSRHKKFIKLTSILLILSLVLPMTFNTPVYAEEPEASENQISEFQFKYPAQHTFSEINQYFSEHPYDTSLTDTYDIVPDISNEEINNRIADDTTALCYDKGKADRDALVGSLSQETLTNALNAANFIRYSAGLQLLYIHTNDIIGGYQWRAQAGAAILAELGEITHNVSQTKSNAAGISNGVFGWAKAGPGGSNLVAGNGVANKIVNSFMPDIGNDSTGLSHRSYILNPGLSGTGFGAANLSGKNKAGNNRGSAVSMFVTYFDSDPDNLTAVLWPSNRQPIETFQARGTWQMNYPEGNPYQGNPWSYFINTTEAKVDTSTLKITLECDGKQTDVLDFKNLTSTEKSENRLFTIKSFPLKTLIGFRPHVAYSSGDKVKVTIEGIVDSQGLPIPVSYDVHFFQTGTEPHPNLEQTSASRTAADTAEFNYTADYAGTMYYLVLDENQTEPTANEILNGTAVSIEAKSSVLNLTSLSDYSAKKLYYITASTTAENKDFTTANKSGEMSDIKSVSIEKYIATPTVTPPTANTLTYNGEEQTLITAGSTSGGTLMYRLGDTGSYDTELPKATAAGDYTVYYKVVGNDMYYSVAEQSISVTISSSEPSGEGDSGSSSGDSSSPGGDSSSPGGDSSSPGGDSSSPGGSDISGGGSDTSTSPGSISGSGSKKSSKHKSNTSNVKSDSASPSLDKTAKKETAAVLASALLRFFTIIFHKF